jgi:serpin B
MRTRILGLLAAAFSAVCIVAMAQTKPDASAPERPNESAAGKVDKPIKPASPLAAVNSADVEAATRNRLVAKKIRDALTKPANFEFKGATIDQIAETLEAKLGVPVRVDHVEHSADFARESEPVKSFSKRITFARANVSSRAALEMMLDMVDAGWTIRHEAIWITSRSVAEAALEVRTYDISDRDANGDRIFADEEALIDLITDTVAPSTWESNKGPASMRPFRAGGIDVLVVGQSRSAHDRIELLLADLRLKRNAVASSNGSMNPNPPEAPAKPAATPTAAVSTPQTEEAANREVGKRLARQVSQPADFELKDASFNQFAEILESKLKIPVLVDVRGLREQGIVVESLKLNFKRANVSIRSALDMILAENELEWIVEHEAVWITTRDHATTALETRLYDISDRDAFDDLVFEDEQLFELITSLVCPTSWEAVGGAGSIKSIHSSDLDVVVISQTRRAHEGIEDLFAELRRRRRAVVPATKDHPERPHRRRPIEELVVEKPAAPLVADPKRDAVVTADNQFAFDLYRTLAKTPRGNVFYSPHSVAVAMSMVKAGAAGKTAEELSAALHVKGADADYLAGRASLNSAIASDKKTAGYDLKVANRLWIQKSLAPQKPFADTLRNTFGGDVGPVDFIHAPSEASKAINDWVELQTAGKIRNLVAPDSIDALTRTVLVNAVYFKGDWVRPFNAELTKDLPFESPSGSKQVPTMEVHDVFAYAARDECRALQLPYDGGQSTPRVAMLILLPRRGDEAVRELEKKLSAEYFADTLDQLDARDVQVQLPKFKFDQNYGLNESLAAIGVKRAFSPKDAELSPIVAVNPPLFLQQVIHRAFIEIDEKGTEAAAATAAFGGAGGIGPSPPRSLVFRADHPFLFVIYDIRTKAVLFLGRVDEPSAAAK